MFNWKFSNEIWPGLGGGGAGLLLPRPGRWGPENAMFINTGNPKCHNSKHHERKFTGLSNIKIKTPNHQGYVLNVCFSQQPPSSHGAQTWCLYFGWSRAGPAELRPDTARERAVAAVCLGSRLQHCSNR